MGILNWFGLAQRPDYLASPAEIASPWASDATQLRRVALGEIVGADVAEKLPMSRLDALQIPAVAKVRNLLVSTVSPLPLVARNASGVLASQPTWLYRTDGQNHAETPTNRMAAIVDDGLFYGQSLLVCSRGAAGQVLRVAHVPISRWTVTNGAILIDEKPVDESEVIFIKWPYEGLLNIGAPTLRAAKDLNEARRQRAKYTLPLTVIGEESDPTRPERSDAEIDAILSYYRQRRTEDGAPVAWKPSGIEVETLGGAGGPDEFFDAALNASTTQIGQLANIRASMLDGTLADSSSETYKNAQGERSAFLTFDLPFWTRPIEDRLSADDVIPAGSSVAFDLTEFFLSTPTPTGSPRED